MALRELESRANGGRRLESVKYCVLGSFKEWAILLCLIIFKMKKMTSWYGLDLFTIPLKLSFIQVIISLPLWIKFTMGQLLFLFLGNFCSFFSYVGGALVANLFSLLLIDIFLLFRKLSHEEHLWELFWSVAFFWTATEALATQSWQQKLAKTASKSFSLSNSSQKLPFFPVLMYSLYSHPRYFKFKQNINNTARVSRLSFHFLRLWLQTPISH